jgi:hypothetical protein
MHCVESLKTKALSQMEQDNKLVVKIAIQTETGDLQNLLSCPSTSLGVSCLDLLKTQSDSLFQKKTDEV